MNGCPVHQKEWKTVPAGTSKRTGKPYKAFQSCPVFDCKEKPTQENYSDTWDKRKEDFIDSIGEEEKPEKKPDWDAKDRRIVRQNTFSHAVKLVIANNDAGNIVLTDVIKIAHAIEEDIYRDE